MKPHFYGVMSFLIAIPIIVSLVVVLGESTPTTRASPATTTATTSPTTTPSSPTFDWWLYLLPFPAFVSRSFLWVFFRNEVTYRQAASERDEDAHRTTILAISGFAVTVFMGLSVVEKAVQVGFGLAAYYSAISFIFFFAAYAIQGFKWSFLIDEIGGACMETGSAGLIAAVISVELATFGRSPASLIIASLGVLAWLIYHIVMFVSAANYLWHRKGH